MKQVLVNLSVAAKFAIVGSILLLLWLITDTTTNPMIYQTTPAYTNSGIDNVSITIGDKDILFNIALNKPMTCKDIFEIFPKSVPLGNKTYLPVCTTVEPTYVIITYKEKITT